MVRARLRTGRRRKPTPSPPVALPVWKYLPEGKVLAFAHRGGAYHPEIEGLENTLAAFRHAAELGYDYLETDVHLTRDGVLLAFHDAVLDRVTDRVGAVRDLTLADIRRARIAGREQVPTLVDLIDSFPQSRFNIDIKSEAAVAPLAALVRERQLWDRVLVGSFSRSRIRRFRRLTEGRVPTAADPWETIMFRFSPSARLATLLAGGSFAAFQVPHRRGPFVVVTPGFLRRAHATGHQVHVWTVDDPAEMAELLDRGVDGLFTDRTDLLKDVLQARGQWWPAPGGNA
ncbi:MULTISPECIES: glycerophosphodiester phosphodiesterase family protein [Nocardioides]|uniref:Glycerophosphodiester phosphodiesterase family protein n=1 Tax=Nocardioides vastitatis TaxID=2568655 RepID=A0ABW0ZG12_9ACTN|nr:glycerophosphodiester phosphodiesterase family protein [Nocardioides sp.]THJ14738.1 glycerophosphodiester phosphodiesterase [Nocardioides sp.]